MDFFWPSPRILKPKVQFLNYASNSKETFVIDITFIWFNPLWFSDKYAYHFFTFLNIRMLFTVSIHNKKY